MLLSFIKIEVFVAEKRMSMGEFCKLARVSPRTIACIRKGRPVQTKTAGKIAATLGVDVKDILED